MGVGRGFCLEGFLKHLKKKIDQNNCHMSDIIWLSHPYLKTSFGATSGRDCHTPSSEQEEFFKGGTRSGL